MLRFSLLVAVTLLAAGVTGCTHCDTCDDFPVPCVGHNTGVPVASAESYTLNVGGPQSTIVTNPTAPAPTVSSTPAPPTGPGPFQPPVAANAGNATAPSLEPLPRGSDVTPPAPASVGSAKAN
ncbi:MAG: hypothetical protein P4L84_02110 [Isosphaeraceae bacterium]|nr:hypothetical protein [Isosphaeraceae bacterium]